jgi:hypothetical protein
MNELKFILRRDQAEVSEHLLEAADYRRLFHPGGLEDFAEASYFRVKTA